MSSAVSYTPKKDTHYVSFQPGDTVTHTPLSTRIAQNCLTAVIEICTIEAGLTDNSNLNSLIERIKTVVAFSEEASDCIITRLNNHQEFLLYVPPFYPSYAKTPLEDHNLRAEEESAQMARLAHSVLFLNEKLESVIKRILELNPKADIPRPRSADSIILSVPDQFYASKYIPRLEKQPQEPTF